MFKIKWDQTGEKLYETGCDRGVIYPFKNGKYQTGAAWNGLENVNEQPSGAEPTALWANNGKYLNLISKEEYGCTTEAYTYPDEFAECDGSAEVVTGVRVGQQPRIPFGFTYRSLIGNDTEGESHGYKLHIVYNCTAKPSEKAHNTINDSPEAASMSWEFATVPEDMPGDLKPSATIEVDSTKCDPDKLAALEAVLYGTAAAENVEAVDARLPLPAEVFDILGYGTDANVSNQNTDNTDDNTGNQNPDNTDATPAG